MLMTWPKLAVEQGKEQRKRYPLDAIGPETFTLTGSWLKKIGEIIVKKGPLSLCLILSATISAC